MFGKVPCDAALFIWLDTVNWAFFMMKMLRCCESIGNFFRHFFQFPHASLHQFYLIQNELYQTCSVIFSIVIKRSLINSLSAKFRLFARKSFECLDILNVFGKNRIYKARNLSSRLQANSVIKCWLVV